MTLAVCVVLAYILYVGWFGTDSWRAAVVEQPWQAGTQSGVGLKLLAYEARVQPNTECWAESSEQSQHTHTTCIHV